MNDEIPDDASELLDPHTTDIGPSPCGHYGWSVTVDELRAALEGLPGDYEVMLSNAEVDDIDISGVNIDRLYPPYAGAPGLVVLGGGQILNHEYGFEQRMDRDHRGIEESKAWNAPAYGPGWRSRK